jgi:Fe2+ transport system protein A
MHDMIPITLAKAGELVTVRKITGNDAIRQHLAELGFVVDANVKVVSAYEGNVILQVHGSRIALNETMARRIMI